jgi:hypothetical protein
MTMMLKLHADPRTRRSADSWQIQACTLLADDALGLTGAAKPAPACWHIRPDALQRSTWAVLPTLCVIATSHRCTDAVRASCLDEACKIQWPSTLTTNGRPDAPPSQPRALLGNLFQWRDTHKWCHDLMVDLPAQRKCCP